MVKKRTKARFYLSDRGVTMIEYTLILSILSMGALFVIPLVGYRTGTTFVDTSYYLGGGSDGTRDGSIEDYRCRYLPLSCEMGRGAEQ